MAKTKSTTTISTRVDRQPKSARRPTAGKNTPTRKPVVSRIELGCPGHFICARDCAFRRHTQVGNYRVSTVGDLYFSHKLGQRQTVGSGPDDFFETCVFKTTGKPEPDNEGCGCVAVVDFSELDGERYATAGAAQAGHEAYVAKYLFIAKAEESK